VEWVGRDGQIVCIVYISRASGACNTLGFLLLEELATFLFYRYIESALECSNDQRENLKLLASVKLLIMKIKYSTEHLGGGLG
jgi:hypothetical protein